MSNQNKSYFLLDLLLRLLLQLVYLWNKKNQKSGSQYVPASSIVEPFMPSLTYKVDKYTMHLRLLEDKVMEILCLVPGTFQSWFLLDLEC